jgi:hypothetical protein
VFSKNTQPFETRAKLLGARSPQGLPVAGRRFCHLLADNFVTDWDDVVNGTEKHPNFMPWVTPIVGTGAEESPSIGEIRGRARTACGKLDGDAARRALRLAESLIETRLHPKPSKAEPADYGDTTPAEWLGVALTAVADLTNAYHQVQSWNSRAVTRSRDDVATLRNDFPEHDTVLSRFISPALNSIDELRAKLSSEASGAAILCGRISNALQRSEPTISRTEIFVLTEYCWSDLSGQALPGWSDLLWRLYVRQRVDAEDAQATDVASSRGPRPIGLDPDGLVEVLEASYDDFVRQSWEARKDRKPNIYSAVADLLAAQTRYFAWTSDEVVEDWGLFEDGAIDSDNPLPTERPSLEEYPPPPHPLAIVTSLDLDLELSLLDSRRPFVIAMPVTATGISKDGKTIDASTWIGLRVPATSADHDYKVLREPAHSGWFALSTDQVATLRQRTRGMPVILRIAGCPLVPLPVPERIPPTDESDDYADENVFEQVADDLGLDSVSEFTHQVLIEEFAGIQQAISTRDHPRSLPSLLVPPSEDEADERHLARFFLVLGVQVDDPAIRSRLAIEIAQTIPTTRASAKRNGLAIIQRVSGAAEDLLATLGLDLVKTSCTEFVEDLQHYTDHLLSLDANSFPPRHPKKNSRNKEKKGCQLDWLKASQP